MKLEEAWKKVREAAGTVPVPPRAMLGVGPWGQVYAGQDGAAVLRLEVRRAHAGNEAMQVFDLGVPGAMMDFLKDSDEWLPVL